MRDRAYTNFLGTLLAGLLIGTGIGILFAPQSGRKTRKEIERLGRRTKDLAWDFQENLKENVNDLIEEVLLKLANPAPSPSDFSGSPEKQPLDPKEYKPCPILCPNAGKPSQGGRDSKGS